MSSITKPEDHELDYCVVVPDRHTKTFLHIYVMKRALTIDYFHYWLKLDNVFVCPLLTRAQTDKFKIDTQIKGTYALDEWFEPQKPDPR
jgi:hypothetical protein